MIEDFWLCGNWQLELIQAFSEFTTNLSEAHTPIYLHNKTEPQQDRP